MMAEDDGRGYYKQDFYFTNPERLGGDKDRLILGVQNRKNRRIILKLPSGVIVRKEVKAS